MDWTAGGLFRLEDMALLPDGLFPPLRKRVQEFRPNPSQGTWT